ncbi:MAG: polysaccharide biosynthesis tyrosine autokinase [Deltaproteobacteria bacterium]|nr:polysaccharide biosynthesis tyrosine autokinase [Candidatus Anaeroferrophillus wilburensis]MBN2888469.1 polysaccharide biosynthesis tyrosine autokinase [Deltaproteobacteria bacterium]
MSRIQDALKKAEQESLAGTAERSVPRAPLLPAAVAEVEPEPVIGSNAGANKPVGDLSQASSRLPHMTSQKIDLNLSLLDEHLVSLTKPFSLASEQIKKLRTKIILSAPERLPNKTILVTSAVPREGKTTIALNLALSLAQGLEEYVLLVDGDFRKPEVSKYLGLEFSRGLATYLTTDIDLSSVLVKTDLSKLSILPMGAAPAKPAELLASERMKNLITDLKTRYSDRYIIFDTTSLLSTTEADILASQVDGIILVVRYGESSRDVIKQAFKNLDRDKVLGVVFNGADYRTSSFYYQEQV